MAAATSVDKRLFQASAPADLVSSSLPLCDRPQAVLSQATRPVRGRFGHCSGSRMTHNCQNEPSESVEQASQPRLCANNCGFFANPACQDMCSKCYREVCGSRDQTAVQSKAAAAALSEALPVVESISPATLPAALKTDLERSAVQPEPSTPEPAPSEVPAASSSPSTAELATPDDRPPQKNPGRCFTCNKRIGLTGFKCRCDYVFCASHRLAEAHDCSFDYKKVERQRLARNNPLIAASKVDKL